MRGYELVDGYFFGGYYFDRKLFFGGFGNRITIKGRFFIFFFVMILVVGMRSGGFFYFKDDC